MPFLSKLSRRRAATRRGAFAAAAALVAAAAAPPAPAQRAPAAHRVRMLGDERGYRFEPAQLTVAPGDRVTFVLVSGAPHNVQFDETSVPAAARAALAAGMPDAPTELMGPMLATDGQTYTVSFAGVPPGTYKYLCTPHAAMNMAGTIVVRGGAAPAPGAGARRRAGAR